MSVCRPTTDNKVHKTRRGFKTRQEAEETERVYGGYIKNRDCGYLIPSCFCLYWE